VHGKQHVIADQYIGFGSLSLGSVVKAFLIECAVLAGAIFINRDFR